MNYQCLFIFFIVLLQGFAQEKDLAYFLDKAQKNSPLLMELDNQIKAAKLDALIYQASYRPQIAANLSANYAPILSGYGYDEVITNGQTVAGQLSVNQKIFGGKIRNTQLDSFRLIADALTQNKQVALKDINKAIIAQYISASANADLISYNQKTTDLLKQEQSILKKLTQNSVYKQTDYLIFTGTVQQQQLVLLQSKQQYRNDLVLLNYLTGETDTTMVSLKKPDLELKAMQDKKQNVFFKQFEADSLKYENQKRIIDNTYKPSLSLSGDAGYLSSRTYQAYKNFGVSVGFALTVPIYDGGQKSLQQQKNDTELLTMQAKKANFDRHYRQQVSILEMKLKQADETAAQLESQLQIAEALIEANRKLLLSGDAQITEYAMAISNIISINNSISQNNINRLQVINEINYWNFNE